MISRGVRELANRPTQMVESAPPIPDCASVGTSGSDGKRVGAVTARATRRCVRIHSVTAPTGAATSQSICPVTVAVTASTAFLNGTWTLSMRAAIANFSAAKCEALPIPADAKVRLFVLAPAMSSATEWYGDVCGTTSRWGIEPRCATPLKSRIGSNWTGITNGLITSALLRTSTVIPSAGAASTAWDAKTPDAPALFSTMTGTRRFNESCAPMARASRSATLPGDAPAINLKGPDPGNCAAKVLDRDATLPISSELSLNANSRRRTRALPDAELLRDPIGHLMSIPVGPVVGDVIAILHGNHGHRAANLGREPVRISPVNEPVLFPGHEEQRTFDLPGNSAAESQGFAVAARFVERSEVAAHPKDIARKLRQPLPVVAEAVRSGQPDACLDARFEGGSSGSVVTAKADPADAHALRVDFPVLFDPVHHCTDWRLVIGPDWHLVLGFALSRTVDTECRDTEIEERSLVRLELFFSRVQPGNHDHHRGHFFARRSAHERGDGAPREWNLYSQRRRLHERGRELSALHGLHVRRPHRVGIVHEDKLREVVVHRRALQMVGGGQHVPLFQGVFAQFLVDGGARGPGVAPVVPSFEFCGDLLEIRIQDAVGDEARRPMRYRGLNVQVLAQADTARRLVGTRSCHFAPSSTSPSRARTPLRSTPTPIGGWPFITRLTESSSTRRTLITAWSAGTRCSFERSYNGPCDSPIVASSTSTPRKPVQFSVMRARLWPNVSAQLPRKLQVLRS